MMASFLFAVSSTQVHQCVPDAHKRSAFLNFYRALLVTHSFNLKLAQPVLPNASDDHFREVSFYVPYVVNGKSLPLASETPNDSGGGDDQPCVLTLCAADYRQLSGVQRNLFE